MLQLRPGAKVLHEKYNFCMSMPMAPWNFEHEQRGASEENWQDLLTAFAKVVKENFTPLFRSFHALSDLLL